ncbi:MAG: 1-acyl-sn-glycerol-3-phosphate acyltransferase [Firmicutes bacterium]|nr:1-acyl-sn-glycerol-3-phosphate acyltransferase [Bacillota bacterium]
MPLLYSIGLFFLRLWCKLGGCRIYGRENIPAKGACLMVANHASFADPILLAVAFPRHITYIAKEQFKRKAFTRWLLGTGLGAVFLDKDEGDISALRQAIKLLKNGKTVGIFPEGRRNFDQQIGQFMPGAAFIAIKANVPVLPVAIYNSHDLPRFNKSKVAVNIGQPIEPVVVSKTTPEVLATQAALFQQKVTELFIENENIVKARQIKA